jgi:hypothetical protein
VALPVNEVIMFLSHGKGREEGINVLLGLQAYAIKIFEELMQM